MNLRTIGITRALRGLREGDQSLLYTGLAMIAIQWLRSSKPRRTLVYRRKIPIGSTLVIRHTERGTTQLDTSTLLSD